MELAAVPDLMIAVVQRRRRIRQQVGELQLALDQRPRAQILAVEVHKIEQEEYERSGIAAGACEAARGPSSPAVAFILLLS